MKAVLSVAMLVAMAATASTSSTEASAPARSCTIEHPLPARLQAASIAIYGEVHGTQQVPQAVLAHVCQSLQDGRPVSLVLEVTQNEQARIDAFLASAGTAEDRAALLAGAFWTRPLIDGRSMQDGRASQAMLSLLDAVRRLAQATGRLKLVAAAAYRKGQDTDAMMAEAIRSAHLAETRPVVVALMGNVHASGARGMPWDPNYQGVGYRLRDLRPAIIDTAFNGGRAWICSTEGCGDKPLFERPDRDPTTGFGPSRRPGHDWTLQLGMATASLPAVPDAPASAASGASPASPASAASR